MSEILEHKGYNGSVMYSAEDRILYGRVVGIRDAITYEGSDVNSLEQNFRKAVDEYLRFCKEEGLRTTAPYAAEGRSSDSSIASAGAEGVSSGQPLRST